MKNYVSWYKRFKFTWYLYRHGKQQTPSDTYQKYPADCTFGGKKVLNIGCGNSVYLASNVINSDYCQVKGINKIIDLSKPPFPFKDNEFDFIIANHVLEHIPNWWECFKELARIVKVGGKIEVWLPGDGGSSQLGFRDHINVINHCSWVGVRETWRNNANAWELEELQRSGFVKDMKIVGSSTRLIDYWWTQLMPESLLNWCITHLRNVVSEHGWFFVKLPPLGENKHGN